MSSECVPKMYVVSSSEPYGDPGTRDRILRATWELVPELGPGVGLADVAARAGVSRQAVYLHFGDRAGLLLALVAWADETLELGELVTRVAEAPTGVEALERMIELHAAYAPRIDAVARVLEVHQYHDPALAAAWRDRMNGRRTVHRAVIERIAKEVGLATGWTVDSATDLFYTVTMPGPWRELTDECAWSANQYSTRMSQLLRRAFVADP